MFESILFYLFAGVLVFSAFGVILSRNPVYSVLFLILAFINSAFLWMLLEAEFLALLLIVVYVGAVAVLFLFVVMMLDVNLEEIKESIMRHSYVGVLIGAIVAIEIAIVMLSSAVKEKIPATVTAKPADYSNTEELGKVLYTDYVYPFELAAIILLVALVIAIVLTLRKRPGLKQQDVAKQVAVDSKDRVRIIKMEAEK